MTEPKGKAKIYYLFHPEQRRQARAHVADEIAKVKAEMIQVERDLKAVKTAGDALDEILLVLDKMREIAVEAAGNPAADRTALSAQLEELKAELNHIAATGLSGWSEVDAVRLRAMLAEMEQLPL